MSQVWAKGYCAAVVIVALGLISPRSIVLIKKITRRQGKKSTTRTISKTVRVKANADKEHKTSCGEKRATVTEKISREGAQDAEEAHRRSAIKETAKTSYAHQGKYQLPGKAIRRVPYS